MSDKPVESVESGVESSSRTPLLCAILFSAGGTVEFGQIEEFFGWSDDEFEREFSRARDALSDVGLTIIEVAGGWRMVTSPAFFDDLKRFFTKIKEAGLSKAALEVLSVIAYRQPCTRASVEEIRGVNSEGVIRGLLERRLIKVKERSDAPGRPFTYVTTDRFLEVFGMRSIADLPRVEGLKNS
ncbi:SMC-Scp complex subunit ScpB [bacterium]|nr:SMC-Scp complex subunit ScpB [bacterium]